MTGRYLSPDQVAELLNVNRKTIYAAIRSGQLPALRLGRTFRVNPDDLQALAFRPGDEDDEHVGRTQRPRPVRGEFSRLARVGSVPDPEQTRRPA